MSLRDEKVRSIDECQIVNDGKNVRTIDEELKNHTRYNAIAAIKTDIACNPFKYLDPFSVNCSYSELAEKIKAAKSKTLSATSKIIFSITMR